ncbi:MAG: DEAD/DEAH box helicase [Acidimicrobiales bacterium]
MPADPPSIRQSFLDRIGFEPDDFQVKAFDAVDDGSNVIVAAPTGAGKTLVADYAVEVGLAAGQRVFYTTPIKALSNQKYHDLVADHGTDNVGLLTGDNNINGDAPAVVMTTEVLRNMLYSGTTLDGLQTVVLDEVHYLQDAYRGPVWEEVIIHLRRSVQLVCLSATVSNADELARWIETVRGPTSLVVEARRPVELTNRYVVGERGGNHLHVIKTLQGTRPNPKGARYDNDLRGSGGGRGRTRGGGRNGRGGSKERRKWRTPDRVDIVQLLDHRDLLPAIHFIFSRAACDDAAQAVVDAGIRLTSNAERRRISQIVADHVRVLDDSDLDVLQFQRFRAGLMAGVAAHHAGMVPPFKEAVEACFVRGLIKVVFATETLALGINMPARTVVLEKLTKFTGEHHEFLTPAQYTQLTGRAGRRGIDTHGEALVLWSPFVRFEQVADLASSRRFVLTSSFRPTYNMAANLVRRYQPERARQLLNLSFAQFRVDSGVVLTEQRVEKLLNRRSQLEGRLEREFGAVEELRAAARTPDVAERDEQAIAFAMSRVAPGDVLEIETADAPSPVVVLAVAFRRGGRIRVKATDRDGEVYELTPNDLLAPPKRAGEIVLPDPYLPNSVSFVYEVGQLLARTRLAAPKNRRSLGPGGEVMARTQLEPGAVKGLRKLDKIERDLERARGAAAARADSLGAQFDRVIELLQRRGHLIDWELTGSGQRLARLYHESDLFLVEVLEDGLFDDLGPPELVALASSFVYEERRSTGARLEPWYPSNDLRRRFRRVQARHLDLNSDESELRLPLTREPDPGFMAVAHGWASGGGLDDVLADEEFTAGDFVRTAKQLIDLLRQLAKLAPSTATGAAARSGADAVYRDLVAASSIVDPTAGSEPSNVAPSGVDPTVGPESSGTASSMVDQAAGPDGPERSEWDFGP